MRDSVRDRMCDGMCDSMRDTLRDSMRYNFFGASLSSTITHRNRELIM